MDSSRRGGIPEWSGTLHSIRRAVVRPVEMGVVGPRPSAIVRQRVLRMTRPPHRDLQTWGTRPKETRSKGAKESRLEQAQQSQPTTETAT